VSTSPPRRRAHTFAECVRWRTKIRRPLPLFFSRGQRQRSTRHGCKTCPAVGGRGDAASNVALRPVESPVTRRPTELLAPFAQLPSRLNSVTINRIAAVIESRPSEEPLQPRDNPDGTRGVARSALRSSGCVLAPRRDGASDMSGSLKKNGRQIDVDISRSPTAMPCLSRPDCERRCYERFSVAVLRGALPFSVFRKGVQKPRPRSVWPHAAAALP
jgi:hypothetical protein